MADERVTIVCDGCGEKKPCLRRKYRLVIAGQKPDPTNEAIYFLCDRCIPLARIEGQLDYGS